MKWNSLVLSLILAGGAVMTHPQEGIAQSVRENAAAKELFDAGDEFLNDGNFAEAERKFREALTKYPKAERSDRTAYYLILTLQKLGRVQDARTEIQNFYRNHPKSVWREDVDQKNMVLSGLVSPGFGVIVAPSPWTMAEEKRQLERNKAAEEGSTALPPNPSREALLLQRQIRQNAALGIAAARERLKADPSDPVVLANLGTIYLSGSPQALPFLLDLSVSEAASPNARKEGFYWAYRYNPDKEQVARVLMDKLAQKEDELVSKTLFRMTIDEHKAVLEKIVASSHPDKFGMIEKIYRGGSITLRTDLVQIVARLTDPKAWAFIEGAAQNDEDLLVRQAAAEVIARRKRATEAQNIVPRTAAPGRGRGPNAPAVSPLPGRGGVQ
jgi:hypothetical protein